MSALPQFSDVDLLGNCKRIVHLDPQIADHAFDPRVSEQELNCSKIPCLVVELKSRDRSRVDGLRSTPASRSIV